jgi:hypothetical protein
MTHSPFSNLPLLTFSPSPFDPLTKRTARVTIRALRTQGVAARHEPFPDMRITRFRFLSFLLTLLCLPLLPGPAALAQTARSGTIITVAGGGQGPDGTAATNALLYGPVGLALGGDGTLYIAENPNAVMKFRAVNPTNGIISTLATAQSGQVNATDPARNRLYFSNQDDNMVQQINLLTGEVSPFAGVGWEYPFTPINGYRGEGGQARNAWFSNVVPGVGVDGAGNVYIEEINRIWKVDIATGIITTIAGKTNTCCLGMMDVIGASGDGGPSTNATLAGSLRIAVDRAGDVFFIDYLSDTNEVIRRIDGTTGTINRIAGGGTNLPGTGPGPALGKRFQDLQALAVNDAGTKLYLGDTKRVYEIDTTTGIAAPFAGNGTNEFRGDGGPALDAEFAEQGIHALAVAPGGGVFISDFGNLRVRYVAPFSIILTNNPGQRELHFPWISLLNGNLIVTNSTNVTVVSGNNVTNVTGSVVIDLNSNSTSADIGLGGLTSVGGDVVIGIGNGGDLNLSSLTAVGGSVGIDISGDGANLNLSSLESVGGDLSITNSQTGSVDLGGATTVGGDLNISGNTATNVDVGSLTNVCGNITISSNAPDAVIEMNSMTNLAGCGTNVVTLDGTVMATNGMTIGTNTTLAGSAEVDGSVTNNGTISPGASPGLFVFRQGLKLNSSSRMQMEIGGYATNQFDRVQVNGALTLGGTLSLSLIGNFANGITNGAAFTLITAGAPITGAFANVASGDSLTTTDGHARFTVLYAGQNTVVITNATILNTIVDTDGDGASDADELLADTDPHDATSVLRIVALQKETDGVRVIWKATGGKDYVVQATTNLLNSFADFTPQISIPAGAAVVTNFFDATPPTNSPARYFRIRLVP